MIYSNREIGQVQYHMEAGPGALKHSAFCLGGDAMEVVRKDSSTKVFVVRIILLFQL